MLIILSRTHRIFFKEWLKNWLLSIDMKTKVVQHVPRIKLDNVTTWQPDNLTTWKPDNQTTLQIDTFEHRYGGDKCSDGNNNISCMLWWIQATFVLKWSMQELEKYCLEHSVMPQKWIFFLNIIRSDWKNTVFCMLEMQKTVFLQSLNLYGCSIECSIR